jgi:hypothetical protein
MSRAISDTQQGNDLLLSAEEDNPSPVPWDRRTVVRLEPKEHAAKQAERFREGEERRARFTPVLRFTLSDAERRTFRAERWCYLGSIDDWIDIGAPGALKKLVRDLIPRLGTDRFFEWY